MTCLSIVEYFQAGLEGLLKFLKFLTAPCSSNVVKPRTEGMLRRKEKKRDEKRLGSRC